MEKLLEQKQKEQFEKMDIEYFESLYLKSLKEDDSYRDEEVDDYSREYEQELFASVEM